MSDLEVIIASYTSPGDRSQDDPMYDGPRGQDINIPQVPSQEDESWFEVNDKIGSIAGVADGMGGEAAGEVASEALKDAARERFQRRVLADDKVFDEATARKYLKNVVEDAVSRLKHYVSDKPGIEPSSTYANLVILPEGRAIGAWIGDSRIYLFRDGEGLRELTNDHTIINQGTIPLLVKRGDLENNPDAIHDYQRTHRMGHALDRAVGPDADIEDSLEYTEVITLQAGDRIAITTDGVHEPMRRKDLERILGGTHPNPESCARALGTYALSTDHNSGEKDNATVVVLYVREAEPEVPQAVEDAFFAEGKSQNKRGCRDLAVNTLYGCAIAGVSGLALTAIGAAAFLGAAIYSENKSARQREIPHEVVAPPVTEVEQDLINPELAYRLEARRGSDAVYDGDCAKARAHLGNMLTIKKDNSALTSLGELDPLKSALEQDIAFYCK